MLRLYHDTKQQLADVRVSEPDGEIPSYLVSSYPKALRFNSKSADLQIPNVRPSCVLRQPCSPVVLAK